MGTLFISIYRARADREHITAQTRRTDVGAASDIVTAAGTLVSQMQTASVAMIGPLEARLKSAENELMLTRAESAEIRKQLLHIEREIHEQAAMLKDCEDDRKELHKELTVLRATLGGRRKEDPDLV